MMKLSFWMPRRHILPQCKVLVDTALSGVEARAHLAAIYYGKDRELFENPGIQQYESQIAHADGSLHDVVFDKATIVDEKGEPDGFVGVILDITSRKHAERRLVRQCHYLSKSLFFLI